MEMSGTQAPLLHAAAGRLDNAVLVFGDFRINQFRTVGSETREVSVSPCLEGGCIGVSGDTFREQMFDNSIRSALSTPSDWGYVFGHRPAETVALE